MKLYVIRFDGSPRDPTHPNTYLALHMHQRGDAVAIRTRRQWEAVRMSRRKAREVAATWLAAKAVRIVRKGDR